MMAELLGRLGPYRESERLMARALVIAPGFDAGRFSDALILHRQSKSAAALVEIDRLLVAAPGPPGYRNLKAAMLARLGDHDAAIAIYDRLLAVFTHTLRGHMRHGHALKIHGPCGEFHHRLSHRSQPCRRTLGSAANWPTRYSWPDASLYRGGFPGWPEAGQLVGRALPEQRL